MNVSWKSPNLSRRDVELLVSSIDDYMYYAKQDEIDCKDLDKLYLRLNNHLEKN